MRSIYYRAPYPQIIAHEVKTPLRKALIVVFDPKSSPLEKIKAVYRLRKVVAVIQKLPKPTLENTSRQSSHILIGIRDRFFKRFKLWPTDKYLETAVDFVIIINETDFYWPFISWWVWELKKSDWPPLDPNLLDPHFFDREE